MSKDIPRQRSRPIGPARQPGHMTPLRGGTEKDSEVLKPKLAGWARHYSLETFSVEALGPHRCPVEDLAAIAPYLRLALTPERLTENQQLADRTSVDNECPHGWLPTDRKRNCKCWR